MAQEYTLRSSRQDRKHHVGKFVAPLEVEPNGLQMTREAQTGKVNKPKPFVLEDSAGTVHTGSLEGGQGANYVLFVMQGSEFRVVPTADWYNFRPKITYKTFSTEEAEEKMASKEVQDRWIMRKLNKNGVEDAFAKDEAESDEEKFTKSKGPRRPKVKEEAEDDQDAEGMDFDERFDDDDERIGEEEPEEQPATPPPAVHESDSEEEEDEDGNGQEGLTSVGKEMKKMLKKNLDDLANSNELFDSSSSNEEEEETEEASKISFKKGPRSASPSPSQPTTEEGEERSKRKRSPSAEAVGAPAAKKRSAPAGSPQMKEVKKEEKEKSPSPEPKKKESTLTEEDVRRELMLLGRVKTKDLIRRFKGKLNTKQQQKLFQDYVKKLARIIEDPPGSKENYLVLKDEYRQSSRS